MKVGLILPTATNEFDAGLGFAEIKNNARQADAAGFDSLWVYDHLLHRFPGHPTVGFWEGWTVLSGVAAITERASVGTWVACTAFRSPALLAKMAVTLDEVSSGRLILGLGAGWHEPEFSAFGYPFERRVDRFEEALQIIVPLLRTGQVDFTGQYYQARDCEIVPAGPRPNGPPLMIGAFGPRMLELTARYADSWNVDWLGPADQLGEHRARLERACAAVGREPSTVAITGSLTIGMPELGDMPSWIQDPSQYLTGTAEDLAHGLRGYAVRGVAEVMCACYPHTPAAIDRLGEAVRLLAATASAG